MTNFPAAIPAVPLVVNLMGGPGTGKSTTAAGVFHNLKMEGFVCELALEFAKDKVWEGSLDVLSDQVYILGKQYHRLHRLVGKVHVVVTDSPLLLSRVYGHREPESFHRLVMDLRNRFWNLDIFLTRTKLYSPYGRTQDELGAAQLDHKIRKVLELERLSHHTVAADGSASLAVTSLVLGELSDFVDGLGAAGVVLPRVEDARLL